MKISVVTPSFNQGRFIRNCLESVKSSLGVEVEHIILDNVSQDETADVLAEFRKRNDGVERKIIVEKDAGQTSAINAGFTMASGDVVCWLNTDETYYEDTLKTVAAFFKANPEIDICFGDCDFVDADGNIVKKRMSFPYNKSMLLYYGCYLPSCATFIRRRVIEDGQLLDPEFRVNMDFEYFVRLSRLGYKFQCIPKAMATFAWHDSNISNMFIERRRFERLTVQRRYSPIRLPEPFRTASFEVIRYSWIAARIVRRRLGMVR